jgi:hypothetical protein
MYEITNDDSYFTTVAKDEASIILASVAEKYGKMSDKYYKTKLELDSLIKICEIISEANYHGGDMTSIIANINKLHTLGILSPLTLMSAEFIPNDKDERLINRRFKAIQSDDNGIYYTQAYKFAVVNWYDNKTKRQIPNRADSFQIIFGDKVWLTAGGVTTGHYFNRCYLKHNTVINGMYTPKGSINLPISVIEDGGKFYYTADKREPKIKALREFYDVDFRWDESMKSAFDIRDYVKLNKE